VPIAAACKAYYAIFDPGKEAKGENPIVMHFTWGFMHLWDNYEDGIANDMYYKAPNTFLQIVYWSCFRNPVNNARITPPFRCIITPSKVRFIGTFGDYNGKGLIPGDVFSYDYIVFGLEPRKYIPLMSMVLLRTGHLVPDLSCNSRELNENL
jgi:hypothetical protein